MQGFQRETAPAVAGWRGLPKADMKSGMALSAVHA
jgi:hypothetical protein